MRKRRLLIVLPLAIVGLAILRYTPVPDTSAKARDVGRLATVVPLIDEIGLRTYRDEDGCRSIDYRGSLFVNDLTGTTCDVIDATGIAFSGQATADFERLRRSLSDAGVGVVRITVMDANEPGAGGNNRQVEFQLLERTPERWAYVYEPGHKSSSDLPSDAYAEINANWFFTAWDPGQQ